MSTTSSTSGITTSTGGNVLRITGLASGLDVDSTVKKLMTAEQYKIDKATQDKQTIQWKQDAYKDIINDVKNLQNSFFDVSMPENNILSSTNYAAADVTGNNAAVATVTAGVGAQVGNYTLQVNALATGANFAQTLSGGSAIALTSKLADITNGANAISAISPDDMKENLTLVLDVNGGTGSLNAGAQTINISLDNTAGALTVKDLVSAINTQGKGAIKATYSELTQKFFLTTVATGATQTLAYSTNLATPTSQALKDLFGAVATPAINADVSIAEPGQALVHVTNQATNNFTIDGMNYNLAGTTATTGNISLSVTQNTQKVFDKFKGFIDKYNVLVDKIQTKLGEQKDKNFKPLTDAQKASMSADQITAWNTKGQVGSLRNDDMLQKMLTDLKAAFTTSVSGSNLNIGNYGSSSFGLDTSSDYSKPNELIITDPVKFKNAISQNGDQFIKLFTNVSTSADPVTQNNENGIFARIQTLFQNNVGRTGTTLNSAILTKYANFQDNYSTYGGTGLNTLADQMYAKDVLIKSLNASFTTKESAFYNKFSALETAMTRLNNQSSSLASMLGQ